MSIILDKVNYVYSEGTAYQIQALKDVNLTIEDGQFIGVIGHTGSGKSTLRRHPGRSIFMVRIFMKMILTCVN